MLPVIRDQLDFQTGRARVCYWGPFHGTWGFNGDVDSVTTWPGVGLESMFLCLLHRRFLVAKTRGE